MRHSRYRNRIAKAVAFTCCTLLLMATPLTARANPKPIPAGSKLQFSFNVIGYPEGKTYQGDCGDGHRIFVNRGAKGAQVRIVNSATSWAVEDCNATADH